MCKGTSTSTKTFELFWIALVKNGKGISKPEEEASETGASKSLDPQLIGLFDSESVVRLIVDWLGMIGVSRFPESDKFSSWNLSKNKEGVMDRNKIDIKHFVVLVVVVDWI